MKSIQRMFMSKQKTKGLVKPWFLASVWFSHVFMQMRATLISVYALFSDQS